MSRGTEGTNGRAAIAAMGLIAVVLSACSSTQDVLEPSAITPPTAGSTASTPTTGTTGTAVPNAGQTAQPARTAAATAAARVHFDPIIGPPVEAAQTLSQRLATRARASGVRLTGNNDPTTTLVLKGYFTPLAEGREVTVIYVWDVYDPAGNRVHRISGQQKATSAGGDAWAAVPDSAMQTIADTTIEQLVTWIAGRSG